MNRYPLWVALVRASIGMLLVALVVLIVAIIVPSVKLFGGIVGGGAAACGLAMLGIGVWKATQARKEREPAVGESNPSGSWRDAAFPGVARMCFGLGLYVLFPVGMAVTILAGVVRIVTQLESRSAPTLAVVSLPWGVTTALAGLLLVVAVLFVTVVARRDEQGR